MTKPVPPSTSETGRGSSDPVSAVSEGFAGASRSAAATSEQSGQRVSSQVERDGGSVAAADIYSDSWWTAFDRVVLSGIATRVRELQEEPRLSEGEMREARG